LLTPLGLPPLATFLASFLPPFAPLLELPLSAFSALLGPLLATTLTKLGLPPLLTFLASFLPPFAPLLELLLSAFSALLSPLLATTFTQLGTIFTTVLATFDTLLASVAAPISPLFVPVTIPTNAVPDIPPMPAPIIPGPMAVVVAPVGIDRKHDDRQIARRCVFDQRHIPLPIVVSQIAGRHPASQVGPSNVAPAIAANATVHVHVSVVRNYGHHRKLR
jgi:hypothetical protein